VDILLLRYYCYQGSNLKGKKLGNFSVTGSDLPTHRLFGKNPAKKAFIAVTAEIDLGTL